MNKKKPFQVLTWIGLALACSIVAACGGDDEPKVGAVTTTPAPTTGLSSDCLNRELFEKASTWETKTETVFASGRSNHVTTAAYTSKPGVSSPAGTGTSLVADLTVDEGDGTIRKFKGAGFVRLDGNLVNEYDAEFTSEDLGTVTDLMLSFTDPSFDLALNESRTLPKTVGEFTTDITYTYLGQESIQTALGKFTACKFTQDSKTPNGTTSNTNWFAVGAGLLLKSESTSTLIGRSLGTDTGELIAATINGASVAGD